MGSVTNFVEADNAALHGLTSDEQKVVRMFVKIARACSTRPELVGIVNRVLERVGLEMVRLH
jgi:hypothetical protein